MESGDIQGLESLPAGSRVTSGGNGCILEVGKQAHGSMTLGIGVYWSLNGALDYILECLVIRL